MEKIRKHAYVKRAILRYVLLGIISLLWGTTSTWDFYLPKLDQSLLGNSTSHDQGLWLVRPHPPNRNNCSETHTGGAIPCLPDKCRLDDYIPWIEWKACKSKELDQEALAEDKSEFKLVTQGAHDTLSAAMSTSGTAAFGAFIVKSRDSLPWSLGSNFTAVLLEFRPLGQRLFFSITNAMNNLPVHWRIQVVGGGPICSAARHLFPVEVAAGKIVLTDIGERPLEQVGV